MRICRADPGSKACYTSPVNWGGLNAAVLSACSSDTDALYRHPRSTSENNDHVLELTAAEALQAYH
jgi:hypothetical protein